jgi:O-antigen/teichoic acid export membrane protein
MYLALYCLVYFFAGFGYLNLASFYNGLGKTRVTLKIGLITFILVATLTPVLTITNGVVGLVAAFLVANFVGTTYGAYVAKHRFNAQFDAPTVLKIGVASLASAVPIVLVRFAALPMFVGIFVGAAVYLLSYVTLIPLLKTITEPELDFLSRFVKEIRLLGYLGNTALRYERKMLRFALQDNKQEYIPIKGKSKQKNEQPPNM